MLMRRAAVPGTEKHPAWALFAALLMLFTLPAHAGAEPVRSPYESVDACAQVDQLEFNGTLANASITEQVNLGPRTTGSNASAALRTVIHQTLPDWNVQNHTYTEDNLTFTNVVATHSYTPVNESTDRVVLVAHYDTRDVAERDPDLNRTDEPIPGANDGASGVAVLLELGRIIPSMNLPYQVELLFTDAEDQNHSHRLYGAEAWVGDQTEEDVNRTTAYIVVDMVGDIYLQMTHVYPGNFELWTTIPPLAAALGLMDTETDCEGNLGRDVVNMSISTGVIDDHVPALNRGIRAIDLIDIRFGPDAEPFGGYWHTHEDTPDKVSAQSLADAGRLVELGLRTQAWTLNVSLNENKEEPAAPSAPDAPDTVEEPTVEVYAVLGASAGLGLVAALILLLVLNRAVKLNPRP